MSVFDFAKPSSVTIIPQTPAPLLDSFRFDAATAVARSHPGSVFRHPIQSGREGVTDAVRIDPDVLQITGVISDVPVAFAAIATPAGRAARMYDLLQKLRELRIALSVATSWTGLLTNRWISEFTASRNSATGAAIEITMTIEKLRIVRTQLVPQQLDADIALLGMATVAVGSF